MYIYICIYIYIYTRICIHTHIYTYILHIYIYTYIYTCSIYIYTYCNIYIYMYSTHFQSWLWDPSMQPLLWPPRYFECEAWGLAIARRVRGLKLSIENWGRRGRPKIHKKQRSAQVGYDWSSLQETGPWPGAMMKIKEWIGWTQAEYLGPLVSQSWKTCLLLPICSLHKSHRKILFALSS